MHNLRIVFLMPATHAKVAEAYVVASGISAVSSSVAESLAELDAAVNDGCDLLLSFSTGVIVPERILARDGLVAVNVHGASPSFPGRDPHHFAHYNRASIYGATIHYMTAKVDSGPIVDTELFNVTPGMTPAQLLEQSTAAGFELIRRFFYGVAKSGWPMPKEDIHWGGAKTTRKDFLALCKVDCSMPADEFERRKAATSMPGYLNLYIELHGCRFRLEGEVSDDRCHPPA